MSTINRGVSKTVYFESPLARRTRPEIVTAELRQLEGLSWHAVHRKVSDPDRSKQISKEAVVSVMRAYHRAGDQEAANTVFLILMGRLSGAIANRMRRWNGVPAPQIEDARQTIILALYEYLFSLDEGEELWECNFKTCFDTRLLNILGKMTRPSVTTLSASQLSDQESAGDRFDAPDPGAAAEFLNVEVSEALHFLDAIDRRLGKAFYLKFFAELSEREIADLMEVNERTIRNWIGLSKKELTVYFAER